MSQQPPLTYTPAEFARLFGKSQSWAYRQLYAGRVEGITDYGRVLIPAREVDKILKTAGRYLGAQAQSAAFRGSHKIVKQQQKATPPPRQKKRFQRWLHKRRGSGTLQPEGKSVSKHWRLSLKRN